MRKILLLAGDYHSIDCLKDQVAALGRFRSTGLENKVLETDEGDGQTKVGMNRLLFLRQHLT